MNKKNELSNIYENNILLAEAKDNVVADKGKMQITKDKLGKEPLTGEGGDEKVKKNLLKPSEDSKFSATKVSKKSMNTESNTNYEGAFERLFKSTLNEDVHDDEAGDALDAEVPTSDEDLSDEIAGADDEASDLASELRSVIDHLESILDKLGHGHTASEEEEETLGDEEEGQEEPFEESVEADEEGHALVDAKKLSNGLTGPKGKFVVKGAVPKVNSKVNNGTIKIKPDTTPLTKSVDTGKKNQVGNIKPGDFFR
jgi:hypothetical protein